VGNALLTGVRRSRWNGTDADRMFAVVRRMPVRLVDDDRDIDRAWELSRRYDEHPLYDMVYVAVAERLGETFVTADAQLLTRLQQLSYVVGLGRQ
jgi:predicted nucleic acid-binding protein